MKKEISQDRKFLIERLSYFRAKKKMSARELSNTMGFSDGYIAKFEMGQINMPSEVLLDALHILEVSPSKFFSKNPEQYDINNELLNQINSLSDENVEFVKSLIAKLK